MAERHGVGLGFSNPCFELWLVLHATDLRRHTERHGVQSMSEELGFTVGKGLHPAAWPTLRSVWETADERSVALEALHAGNDSPPSTNPSTSVGQVVRALHRR